MGVWDRATVGTINKILDVLLIPLVAFFISLKLQEHFNVNVFLIAAALVYLLKNTLLDRVSFSGERLNRLDYAFLFVALTELVTYWTSTYRPNTFHYLVEALFFFLFYTLVRFNLKHEYQRVILYVIITLWGLVFSGVEFYNSFILNRRLANLGFTDITDFRNYISALNPLGISIGEWVTVYFLLAAFPLILFIKHRHSRLLRSLAAFAFVVILLAILLTFNRGAYIAFFAAILTGTALFFFYKVFPLKKILLFNAVTLGLLAICLLPLAKPVVTTLSLFKTTSQVRSVEGRANIWRNSVKMVKDHPLFGVGAFNFPFQYSAYKDQESDSAFAIRPFNYFLQILIEKGVLGLVAYGLLTLSFLSISYQKIKLLKGDVYRTSVVICFVAAYVAVMVRDLSESSIFNNRGVYILLCFMMAVTANLKDASAGETTGATNRVNTLPVLYMIVALLLFTGAHWKYRTVQRAEAAFNDFTQQLGRKQFDNAEKSIGRGLTLSPRNAHYLSNAALLQERMLDRRFDFARFAKPELDPQEAAHVANAISLSKQVLELNPNDDHVYHNLGWLYWLSQQPSEAVNSLRRAVMLDGQLPLYRVSLGLVLEYSGDQDAAAREYAGAIQASPALNESQFFKDYRQRANGQANAIINESIAVFEDQLKRGAGATVMARLGRLHMESDPQRGADLLLQTTRELPNLSRPWFSLGNWYQLQGDEQQAERCYRRAIFLDALDVSALAQLAGIYDRRQRTAEAIGFYRRAVGSWVGRRTAHFDRVRRIYISRYAVRDDLIPAGIAAYTSPSFDLEGTCQRLAVLLRQQGDNETAKYYEELAKEHVP